MYNFLIIGLLLLGHSQAISSHFDEDIVPDLKSLLANSSIPKTDGESLEAELIRSYVHAHKPNMKFFSHPEKFHDHWKEFLGKHDRQPIVKEIFLVMGRLHRAVLSNGQKEYYDFADALNQGMARIVQGDLGFRKSSMQEDEKDIFAKELLVSGRSLASNVWNSTDQLGFHYILASDLKEKRHLQISALLMLAGHDRTLIDDSGWYLKDVSEADKERLLAWVYDSADCLLPARFKAGSMDAQIEEYANSVEFLKAFEVRQKQQLKDALRKGVSWHIANENGGNFPDREYLARAETFFENLKGEHRYHTDFYNIQALSNIINLIFKGKKLPDWDQFLTFPNRLIGNGDSLGKSTNFVVYTHFPDELKRKDFVEFSRNYMRNTKILIHNLEETENLVLAYESFDDEL